MIEIVNQGVVYRNPKPHLQARHAWHPSIVRLGSGELLASFDLGQAVESLDYGTWASRSRDQGRTWSDPQPLVASRWLSGEGAGCRCTHSIRLGAVNDGTLVGLGSRWRRADPQEGLVNRSNLGYVPMELFLVTSHDGGQTFGDPQTLEPSLEGPAFELCHRVIELADGRWLAPTSTWKGWNGEAPNGMQAVALVSHDRGRTWPEHLGVINQYDRGLISWEIGMAQLPDGCLVAVVWCFDERRGASLPNVFAVSTDGQRFGAPRETGMRGETAKLTVLPDGRLLCLFRRLDRPGLWANLVALDRQRWVCLEEACLWSGPATGMTGSRAAGDELGALKFGYPSATTLPDGGLFVVFWCVEDCLHVIRWMKLAIP